MRGPLRAVELSHGSHAVQPAEAVVALTQEEEAGLVAALESLQAGKALAHEEVTSKLWAPQRR
jgi:predicted transcriptional regulator